jgi:hypothetical protein
MGKIREEMEKVVRENAIKDLKELQIDIGSSPDDLDNSPLYYALDIAIKALKQPCEDCISRIDLIAVMHLIMDDAKIGDNDEDYESLDDIKEQYIEIAKGMPSVTPSIPRGKWIFIRKEYRFMGGIVNEPQGCKCSNCNKVVRFKSNFCPNCGADMRESEELSLTEI